MILSQTMLVILGLLLAAWMLGAAYAILAARARARQADAALRSARRLSRMVDGSFIRKESDGYMRSISSRRNWSIGSPSPCPPRS